MNAEELLKHIKGFVEGLEDLSDMEAIITPTMYDPRDLQHDVSVVIMEKVKVNGKTLGTLPRYRIDVKDLEGIRNNRKLGI